MVLTNQDILATCVDFFELKKPVYRHFKKFSEVTAENSTYIQLHLNESNSKIVGKVNGKTVNITGGVDLTLLDLRTHLSLTKEEWRK